MFVSLALRGHSRAFYTPGNEGKGEERGEGVRERKGRGWE